MEENGDFERKQDSLRGKSRQRHRDETGRKADDIIKGRVVT